tara:strand:- start:20330 stop:20848 length:519 start_codon:yes stop_codon:yes gene_type:complete
MARTLTLPKKGTGLWNEGWHELTISKATYGEWNDSKYIDVWFDGYPDNFNMRVYSKVGKSGEEFAIGNLFRFANAGISDALESAEGETVIKMNDDADELKDKTVNVYFYKSGKFTRILNQVAPMPFTNIVEEFNDKDVKYFKGRAEKYFKDYIQPKLEDTVEEETVTNDMPY